MRIDKIELTNFRCFETFTLELHPQFTLLVGENGAGKSSLLHALRLILGAWLDPHRFDRWASSESDIHQKLVQKNNRQFLEFIYPCSVDVWSQIDSERILWGINQLTSDEKFIFAKNKSAENIFDSIENLKINIEKDERLKHSFETWKEHIESPVMLGFRSIFLAAMRSKNLKPAVISFFDPMNRSKKINYESIKSFNRRSDNYIKENASMLDVVSWMKWREEAKLQSLTKFFDKDNVDYLLKASETDDIATIKKHLQLASASTDAPELDAVSSAVCLCLENAVRFFYHIDSQQLRVEFSDDRILPYNVLSDGQRRIIGMVATLAWQAYQLNPHHGADAAKEAVGVVLIDELDLHLHPRWQREIIGNLTKVFPKIQFVATTHSPQVISTAKPEWLRVIAPGQTEALRVDAVHGRDSNAILRDVMGVSERPAWMERELDELNTLIENEKLKEAQALFKTLLMHLGPNDQTLMGLAWELKDAEIIHAKD